MITLVLSVGALNKDIQDSLAILTLGKPQLPLNPYLAVSVHHGFE